MAGFLGFYRILQRVLCVTALFFCVLVLPTTSFANNYACGSGNSFPMTFAGCREGYYYQNNAGLSPAQLSLLSPGNVEACLPCPNGKFCAGGFAEPAKPFTIFTTSTNSFQFKMTAEGTFYVDCGTGGTLSGTGVSGNNTITRTDTTEATYTCNWNTTTTHTIQFDGEATYYNTDTHVVDANVAAISFNINGTDSDTNAQKIDSVSGSLSALFPYETHNAKNGAQPRFVNTFRAATNLTSVPATLFKDYTTGATYMFFGTFSGCTSLEEIPSGLFSNITTGAEYMFAGTFLSCTSLETIPSGLFSNITTGATYNMFKLPQ